MSLPLFQSLGALVVEPLTILDERGLIRAANAAAKDALGGATLGAAVGKNFVELCSAPERMSEYLRHCARSSSPLPGGFVLAEPHSAHSDRRYRCKASGVGVDDGSRVVVMRFFRPERDDQFVMLGQTIERLNDEILRRKLANAELAAAVRVRDDFLAVAGHELRTPLTALRLQLTAVNRLAKQGHTAAVASAVDKAIASADRLRRLSEELLENSRLTDQGLLLDRVATDLSQLVERIVAQVVPDARRTGLVLRAAEAVVGEWDAMRLEQVVTNLVVNALKFGRGAPVEIAVSGDAEEARLVVRDHGIGIAKEAQQNIFDKFNRAVSSEHFGGFGLGLWISRQIVEAHGGTIAVESQLGHGATFIVTLPRRRQVGAQSSSSDEARTTLAARE